MTAEPDRKTVDDDFADTAQGVAVGFRSVDARDHLRLGVRIECPQRRAVGDDVDVRRKRIRALGINAAQVHEVRADGDAELREQVPADGAGSDARSGLARGGALENVARVVAIVLEEAGEIGMARAHAGDPALASLRRILGARRGVHDVQPVVPVTIRDEHRDGRAQRFAGADAGNELDVVLFDLHTAAAAVALLSAHELLVDVGGEKRQAGGAALENGDEGFAVAFSCGRETNRQASNR